MVSEASSLYDVLRAVPCFWNLVGKQAARSFRAVSREGRTLHDAACLSLHVNTIKASPLFTSTLSGKIPGLDALEAMAARGCRPTHVAMSCDTSQSEGVKTSILRIIASNAAQLSFLGFPRLSIRLALSISTYAPRLQHLTLELPDLAAAKTADSFLAALAPGQSPHRDRELQQAAPKPGTSGDISSSGTAASVPQLRNLELRLGPRGVLPTVGLEACTRLEGLRLQLEMQPTAPLGALRMRGDEAPPAVEAIASLQGLRSLELYGSAMARLLDPPHRLRGLHALTGLTRLRVDLPSGFGAGLVEAAVASGENDDAGNGPLGLQMESATEAAAAAVAAAEARWRAVPVVACIGSLAELHLGRSYECSVEDMAVLSRASQLTYLACRAVTVEYGPVPAERRTGGAGDGGPGLLRGPGARAGAAPSVPMPPRLRELQVRHLPCVPVLAALEALPDFASLKCRQTAKAAAVTAIAARTSAALAAANAVAAAASASVVSAVAPLAIPGKAAPTEVQAPAAALLPAAPGQPPPAPPSFLSGVAFAKLYLVGTSCRQSVVWADPWVAPAAHAAFRLLARLSQPSASGPASLFSPLELPPALSIRPFAGGSSSVPGQSCVLAGPLAGAWLSSLAALQPIGLSTLQLRHFTFPPGDLQLLQVALPELRDLELWHVNAPSEEVLGARRWLLRRPGQPGAVRSDVHAAELEAAESEEVAALEAPDGQGQGG